MQGWLAQSPEQKYGGGFLSSQKATPDATPLPGVAGPSPKADTSPLSPQSPLFWAGVLVAASVGLMAYSTAVRVGPVSASLNLGK